MIKKINIFIIVLLLIFSSSCNISKNNMEQKYLQGMVGKAAIFEAAEVENVRITSYKLNIRSGSGTNHSIVGVLNKDQIVEVVGKLGSWYVIHLPNDLIGCISSKYAEPVIIEEEPPLQNVPYKLTDLEKKMIDLVNQERKKANVNPLIVDWEVARVARFKSQDMVDNNYFSHHSPIYGSPFDMLTNFGIKYIYAGENIAANSTVERAHESLMNSEGHKNNILNKNFTHIGIGIVESPRYGYIFTQQFISK